VEFDVPIEENDEDSEDRVCEECNAPAAFVGQRFCMKCPDTKAKVLVSKDNS